MIALVRVRRNKNKKKVSKLVRDLRELRYQSGDFCNTWNGFGLDWIGLDWIELDGMGWDESID